jgi:ribosomal protein S18 acetylase RimI-like enzyme
MDVIAFRSATVEDIPMLRELATTIWRSSYRTIISGAQIEYMLAMMYGSDVIAKEMSSGVTWELILDGAEPVGYLSFGQEAGTADVKLHKLYLLPPARGAGIAQRALGRLRDAAAALGGRRLWLQVNKRNTQAIRAYERFGFRVAHGIVCDIGGGFVMDDYVMTFDIAAGGRSGV